MSLKIKIDTDSLAAQCKEFALEAKQELEKGVASLAAITHAKVVELANDELKTSRKDYMDALGFEEVSEGVWVVSVDEKALWIEEGIEPNFDMKPGLLKNGKVSKKGYKYRVIPFEHSKAPSQMTEAALNIVSEIREKLKKEKVPFKSLETDSRGNIKLGKIHSFDWGGKIPGKGNTPALKNVSIYQTLTKTGNVRRDIMTFRTVSGSPASNGKWIHPGLEAQKFLDQAMDWAIREWEDKILPEIMNKWEK